MAKKKKTLEEMGEYTRKCAIIDNLLYERDEDNNPTGRKNLTLEEWNLVEKYLKDIITAFAIKKKLLQTEEDYIIFIKQEVQGTLDRILRDDLPPLKSIKNYIEFRIVRTAITFAKKKNKEIFNPYYANEEQLAAAENYMTPTLMTGAEDEIREESRDMLGNIDQYIDQVVNESIFKYKPLAKNNLKLSIKLSLLNALTLETKNNRLDLKERVNKVVNQFGNMKDYIVVWGKDNLLNKDYVLFYIKKVFLIIKGLYNEVKQDAYSTENLLETTLMPFLFEIADDDGRGEN